MKRSDILIRWKYKFINFAYRMWGLDRGTAMDRVLRSSLPPKDWQDIMDDAIDEWHVSNTKLELHEFLGMTWDEYKLWAERPMALYDIVGERLQNLEI